jgi:hypothetical protein
VLWEISATIVLWAISAAIVLWKISAAICYERLVLRLCYDRLVLRLFYERLVLRLCYDRFLTYSFLAIKQRTKFFANNQFDALFLDLFITPLYMFPASQCPSSGDRIVSIHHLVRLVYMFYCTRRQHCSDTILFWLWCINTIRSPDDGHCDARNM